MCPQKPTRSIGKLGFFFLKPTDLGRFRRSTSPGKFWQETVEWYCPKTTGNKIQLRKDFNNFHVQEGRNPIPALFGLKEHVELMRDAGIIVDSLSMARSSLAFLLPSTNSKFEN